MTVILRVAPCDNFNDSMAATVFTANAEHARVVVAEAAEGQWL
jgi:hypothetical protein